MNDKFNQFLLPLKETHFSLCDYADFKKAWENVESIAIKLNALNYLIGQEDISSAVERLWQMNPDVFSVLDILIAVRKKDHKKVVDNNGVVRPISDFFNSPGEVVIFLEESGVAELFRDRKIKSLVDYVFGVEVGLDSNARKNRGGHLMEAIVADVFRNNDIDFRSEVYYNEFPEIANALGADKKRFDFVIKSKFKTYLIEVNFFSGGGSKLNEVARSYSELAPKINAVNGYEFIWITDGVGWHDAKNKLEEAFRYIPGIYNLTTISDFISKIKAL